MRQVLWFTGLPASGKSTLARAVKAELDRHGYPAVVLDSDELRACLVPAPGYLEEERRAFYETLARLAAVLSAQGLVVLVAATAHRAEYRERARALNPTLSEVFVDTPLEVCRARDPKGLYRAATDGLPGGDEPYERPEAPAHVVRPSDADAAAALARVVMHRGSNLDWDFHAEARFPMEHR